MIEDWIDEMSRYFDIAWKNEKPALKKQAKPALKYSARQIVEYGKVFYQDKRTVLRIGDDVFMSVPEKGEKYDKEKGLLICIMKAMGLSTSDFLKIKENSKDVKKKGVSHKTR